MEGREVDVHFLDGGDAGGAGLLPLGEPSGELVSKVVLVSARLIRF